MSQQFIEDVLGANSGVMPVKLDSTASPTGLVTNLYGDAGAGQFRSVDYTLGTADTVTTITVSDSATGYRITNVTQILRVNIGAVPPSANVTGSGTTYNMTSAGTYNLVPIGVTEIRKLVAGTSRTIQINSDTAAATFTIEVW